MSFSWPWALLSLLALPLLFGIWWWLRRRRRATAVRVTSIALVRAAVPGRTRWRRRIPVALLALSIVVLGVGVARPQASVSVPSTSSTILLALDVSGSMCSTDVDPNRITAAEAAASDFIKSQAGGPQIGLVAFAGTAGLLVPPTHDTQSLLKAIGGLTTSRGTAIGQAILTSIDAIAQVDPTVAPTGAKVGAAGTPKQSGYAADAIVVLTDGANTQGVTPAAAAKQAAERRVRVFTIGFGTTTPAPLVCSSSQTNGSFGNFGGFGGGGFGGFDGGRNPLTADLPALREVAKATGGTFYRAQNAGQLHAALSNLPHTFTLTKKQLDLSAWFAGVGGLLAVAAIALSLWWGRIRRAGPRDAARARDVRTRSP